MARRSLVTEILLILLLVVVLSLIAATWNASRALRQFHFDETAAALETRARLIERDLQGRIKESASAEIESLCKEIGKVSDTRITVILPSGRVIGDSEEDPARMDNHADRPEVIAALQNATGKAIRYSHTLNRDLMYVALPARENGNLVGVVRTSVPLAPIERVLSHVFWRMGSGAIFVGLLTAALSVFLSRYITRPLRSMTAGARRFAHGDFDARLPLANTAELSELASAMNAMAVQLRDRIHAMDRQREELEGVLSSMVESVVAVDTQERIVLMNRAATVLFGASIEADRGRAIQEVIRNPKLQQCVARALASGQAFEDDAVVVDTAEHFLHVSASALRDGKGNRIGALLVLNDVTELRRLERARSDFIANVSHEIRTPVTSIKGYAETLLGDSQLDAATSARFIEIILRQSDRLCSLVDDILSLASLERSEASGDIAMEKTGVRALIDAAIAVCAAKSDEKGVCVRVACLDDIEVRAHAFLLEQALVNLLDNAIKYSEPGAEILIEAEARDGGEVELRVRDSGAGIAQEHLARIFERFYRVDKARSRKLGGTGLGLAIVKHIMTLHNGRISVESALGKGSCFILHLPA